MILSNHDIAGLTSKAGKPFHLLPSWRRILTAVRVRAAHNYRIPATLSHHLSKRRYPLSINICHSLIHLKIIRIYIIDAIILSEMKNDDSGILTLCPSILVRWPFSKAVSTAFLSQQERRKSSSTPSDVLRPSIILSIANCSASRSSLSRIREKSSVFKYDSRDDSFHERARPT